MKKKGLVFMNPNEYHVLFTGGLDSAYRLCQLAIDDKAIIEPIYLLFPDDGKSSHIRPEIEREIKAQDDILKYLQNHPNTKATFLPIKRIHRDEIPKWQSDDTLMNSGLFFNWELRLAKSKLGWQYYYIALYSHWDIGVELCQETFRHTFDKNNLNFYKDENGRVRLNVAEAKGTHMFFEFLFGDLTYPVLGVTRDQMLKDLEKWGYKDVLKYIWFCYQSVDGKPCGVCDNCIIKIK